MRVYGVQYRFGWLGFIDRISYSTRSRAIILPPKLKQTDITHPESWRKPTRRVGEITRKRVPSPIHIAIFAALLRMVWALGPCFHGELVEPLSVIAP